MRQRPGVPTHELQDVPGEKDSSQRKGNRGGQSHNDRLHRGIGRSPGIFLADPPRHQRGRSHGQADGDGIDQGEDRFSQAHRGHG